MIEEDEVGVGHRGRAFDLFQFPASDERGGVRLIAGLEFLAHYHGAGARGQLAQFGEPGFVRLNFATQRARLAEALSRMRGAVERLGRR